MKFDMEKVKFDANGLMAAIAQDEKTGEILMLAWMNKEALEKTLVQRRGVGKCAGSKKHLH